MRGTGLGFDFVAQALPAERPRFQLSISGVGIRVGAWALTVQGRGLPEVYAAGSVLGSAGIFGLPPSHYLRHSEDHHSCTGLISGRGKPKIQAGNILQSPIIRVQGLGFQIAFVYYT